MSDQWSQSRIARSDDSAASAQAPGPAPAPKAREPILGLKPYVPGKPIEEVQRELGLTGVIKLASNENPLGPSPKALEVLRGELSRVHLYPDSNDHHLKKAVAAKLGVSEEEIIIGNGSDEVMRVLGEAFLDPGDEVIIPTPSFSEYEYVARLCGATPVFVPLCDDKMDLEAMAAAVAPRTRIVFICSPNNPTGTIITARELDQFLDRVPDHVIVAIDEAYSDYAESSDYHYRSLDYVVRRNVIVTRTFSKIYGLAYLRLGYGVARPEITRPMRMAREPFSINGLAQVAGAAAITDEAHVEASRRLNSEGKLFLSAGLDKLGLRPVPTEANFILIDTGRPSLEVFEGLLRLGVIVRPAKSFGLPKHIRVTIGTPQQNARFLEALGRVLG